MVPSSMPMRGPPGQGPRTSTGMRGPMGRGDYGKRIINAIRKPNQITCFLISNILVLLVSQVTILLKTKHRYFRTQSYIENTWKRMDNVVIDIIGMSESNNEWTLNWGII